MATKKPKASSGDMAGRRSDLQFEVDLLLTQIAERWKSAGVAELADVTGGRFWPPWAGPRSSAETLSIPAGETPTLDQVAMAYAYAHALDARACGRRERTGWVALLDANRFFGLAWAQDFVDHEEILKFERQRISLIARRRLAELEEAKRKQIRDAYEALPPHLQGRHANAAIRKATGFKEDLVRRHLNAIREDNETRKV